MKIRMLKTENGSIDGVRVTTYNAGQEYDLTGSAGERDLAAAFVNARMAVEVKVDFVEIAGTVEARPDDSDPGEVIDAQSLDPIVDGKAIEAAPENKAVQPAENKRGSKRKG